jgi:ABC-type branched-subunit amino acid transport system substrate-binding protein
MIFNTYRCPEYWKEGKTVMIPKPVTNEVKKKKSKNSRPIILMCAMRRISFSIIANYLQKVNINEKHGIISTQQKGFIKGI